MSKPPPVIRSMFSANRGPPSPTTDIWPPKELCIFHLTRSCAPPSVIPARVTGPTRPNAAIIRLMLVRILRPRFL
jgi:hypothetical protein